MASQDRRTQTTKIGGGADYAKVADRLKLFRQDHANSKQESAYEVDVDGTIVFTVWLWKDKKDLLDLMKAGIIDKDALRSSADANGNAKSNGRIVKEGSNAKAGEKEFEKLESVALGRALAMLGYLASGEIASSEEMEQFEEYKETKAREEAEEFIQQVSATKDNKELNTLLAKNQAMLKNRLVIEAAKVKQQEFAEADKLKKPEAPAKSKTPAAVDLPKNLETTDQPTVRKEGSDVANN